MWQRARSQHGRWLLLIFAGWMLALLPHPLAAAEIEPYDVDLLPPEALPLTYAPTGLFFRVETKGEHDVVSLGLDRRDIEDVDPQTLALFRLSDDGTAWRRVPSTTRFAEEGRLNIVASRAPPGIYLVAGLPQNIEAAQLVENLCLADAAISRQLNVKTLLTSRICPLIQCARPLPGSPVEHARQVAAQNICEICNDATPARRAVPLECSIQAPRGVARIPWTGLPQPRPGEQCSQMTLRDSRSSTLHCHFSGSVAPTAATSWPRHITRVGVLDPLRPATIDGRIVNYRYDFQILGVQAASAAGVVDWIGRNRPQEPLTRSQPTTRNFLFSPQDPAVTLTRPVYSSPDYRVEYVFHIHRMNPQRYPDPAECPRTIQVEICHEG